jgi:hypothetical protein
MAGTGPYHRLVDACSSLPYRAALIDGEVMWQTATASSRDLRRTLANDDGRDGLHNAAVPASPAMVSGEEYGRHVNKYGDKESFYSQSGQPY